MKLLNILFIKGGNEEEVMTSGREKVKRWQHHAVQTEADLIRFLFYSISFFGSDYDPTLCSQDLTRLDV